MRVCTIIEGVFGTVGLQTLGELAHHIELFDVANNLTGGQYDTLYAAFKYGPLFDGDVPSKDARDALLSARLLETVIVKGRDGFSACTLKGAKVYRLMCAIKEEVDGRR